MKNESLIRRNGDCGEDWDYIVEGLSQFHKKSAGNVDISQEAAIFTA